MRENKDEVQMTDAEKSFICLEAFIIASHRNENHGDDIHRELLESVRCLKSTLKRAAECEKVIDQYAETIRIQTVNGNSLKRKARGLIKALEDIAYSKTFRVQNKPFELVAIALQALAAFNSDETEGVGL